MSDDEKKAFHARIISMERIENEYLIVEINERGAELIRIFSKKNGVEYLWDGDPAYWKKHSPVLFPFIGRMKDQKYTYRGRTFDAEKHGFVSVTDFSVEDKGADHVVFSFSGEDKSYPFPLTFKMIYRLDENRLEMSAYIENGSDRPMPYAIGFHPGFKIPLSAGLQFEDYYLWFPDAGNVMRAVFSSVFLDSGRREVNSLNKNRIMLEHGLFDNDAIVLTGTGNRVVLKSDKSPASLTVSYDGFPYLGIWHPMKSDAPFLCIEPWSSMPGPDGIIMDLEKKSDYLSLGPGSSAKHGITVEIE